MQTAALTGPDLAYVSVVPASLLPDLLAVVSKKEKAKAKRKAGSENISEEAALCAIFVKAAGKYPLEKFIAQRKIQREKQKAQAEQQRQREANTWKGWFDGAAAPSNPGPRGVGALLVSPSGDRFEVSVATGFGTNNEAEYQALIELFKLAVERQVSELVVFGDSQLVVNQVNGEWDCKAPTLYGLMCSAKSLRKQIKRCDLRWIPREMNGDADVLSKRALGVAAGVGINPTKRKRSSIWGSQTDIGSKMHLSAIAVGRLLDATGLREGKLGSKKALDAGLAKNSEGGYGLKTEWNIQMVVEAIQSAQGAEEVTQSGEDVLRQAEDDMGLPTGTLDVCMDAE